MAVDRSEVSRLAHHGLQFMGPYGAPAVRGALAACALPDAAAVLDVGCGGGAVLVDVLTRLPSARGVGVDPAARLLELARARARRRGLAARARFVCATVQDARPAEASWDLVVCVGATHAFGTTREALAGCRALMRSSGFILLGEGFWEQPPTAPALAALQGTPEEFHDLDGLLALAESSGLDVLHVRTSTLDEWDAYEHAWCANLEHAAQSHPDGTFLRSVAETHRAGYEHGYRSVLGFALLALHDRGQRPVVS